MLQPIGNCTRFLNRKRKFKNQYFSETGLAIVGRINGKPGSSSPGLKKNCKYPSQEQNKYFSLVKSYLSSIFEQLSLYNLGQIFLRRFLKDQNHFKIMDRINCQIALQLIGHDLYSSPSSVEMSASLWIIITKSMLFPSTVPHGYFNRQTYIS